MSDPKINSTGRMDVLPDTPRAPVPIAPISPAVREKLPEHGSEISRRVLDVVKRK